ncbi:hypothetical protein BJ508DRAFT_326253 [Ascobolus immersus RN42]|uniref:Uncharacterized protein n=1 Tax=Ascobolus immersus RN42 TaxID=1160509 RepID=A0A3N4I648_ASCIM|nr:hypothetical protein BJ508DRAFT_326253 [Ascobolus immersus RN42]
MASDYQRLADRIFAGYLEWDWREWLKSNGRFYDCMFTQNVDEWWNLYEFARQMSTAVTRKRKREEISQEDSTTPPPATRPRWAVDLVVPDSESDEEGEITTTAASTIPPTPTPPPQEEQVVDAMVQTDHRPEFAVWARQIDHPVPDSDEDDLKDDLSAVGVAIHLEGIPRVNASVQTRKVQDFSKWHLLLDRGCATEVLDNSATLPF